MSLTRAFIFLTCGLALFPVLKLNHFSILMIVWFVTALVLGYKNHAFEILREKWKTILILGFFCAMYLIYLPFATDFKEMNKLIIKSLPFIIFPIGLLLNRFILTRSVIRSFIGIFIVVTLLVNALGWVKVVGYGPSRAFAENDFYHPLFRSFFSDAASMHLPYLGLISSFAALCLVYRMIRDKAFSTFSFLVVLFLVMSMYLYSARMAIGCFVVGLLFMTVKSTKKTAMVWGAMLGVPLTCMVLFWISPLKERYLTSMNSDWVLPHKGQHPHEVNYRYGIWYCATKLIQQNMITGVGADRVQEKLNSCYSGFTYESYEDFSKVSYNTHNQYLDQLLKFGIIGLFLFFIALFYYVPGSSMLYQVFILLVTLSFLTENILDRQMGVVFVSLLNSIFVAYKFNSFEKGTRSRLAG